MVVWRNEKWGCTDGRPVNYLRPLKWFLLSHADYLRHGRPIASSSHASSLRAAFGRHLALYTTLTLTHSDSPLISFPLKEQRIHRTGLRTVFVHKQQDISTPAPQTTATHSTSVMFRIRLYFFSAVGLAVGIIQVTYKHDEIGWTSVNEFLNLLF